MERTAIRAIFHSPHFLVSPAIQNEFYKFSDTSGRVDMRESGGPSPALRNMTRMMEAFQHYVVVKSNETVLITDLQGALHCLYSAGWAGHCYLIPTHTAGSTYTSARNPHSVKVWLMTDPEVHT